jgi:hypothetical protein
MTSKPSKPSKPKPAAPPAPSSTNSDAKPATRAKSAKSEVLHIRFEDVDVAAIDALVAATSLDKSTLVRLCTRIGLRAVALEGPMVLLAPSPPTQAAPAKR